MSRRVYEDRDEQFKNETFHNQEFSVPHTMKPLYKNYVKDPFRSAEFEIYHDPHFFARTEKHHAQPFVHICKNGVRIERTPSESRSQYARHDTTARCFTPVVHGAAAAHNKREVSINTEFRSEDSRLNHNMDHDMH